LKEVLNKLSFEKICRKKRGWAVASLQQFSLAVYPGSQASSLAGHRLCNGGVQLGFRGSWGFAEVSLMVI